MIDRQRLLPPALRRPSQRPYPAPLLPAGARRPAAILGVGCLVLVVVLGIISWHQGHGNAVDRLVDSWVIGLGVPEHILATVSRIGGVTATTVLTAVLAVACLAARRVSGAVLAVAGVALASAMTEFVLKPLVHRTITGFLSYPSGHTTGLFALTTAIAMVLIAPRGARPGRAVRVAIVAAAALVASAVGLAMVSLGFHYFTDTIAGAAVGTGVVIGVAFLLDLPAARRWLRWPGR
ncbi:MAG TPA: phosphatase PAP2 family protein [Streptosporangiaceae bacterium]